MKARVWLVGIPAFLTLCFSACLRMKGTDPNVTVYRDIVYREGSKNPAHRLDVYLPVVLKPDTPVLVMVHGGAWLSGAKGAYEPLARNFAAEGVVAIVPEYRFSPGVRHPDHAEDIRAALRWTRDQSAKYGFDPKRIFLMGHSAGAHMAAWLATAVEPGDADPAGFIGIAGIYDLPQLDRVWPGYDKWFLNIAFGERGAAWKDASPARRPILNKRPWILVHGEADELCDVGQSKAFAEHLKQQGVSVEFVLDKTSDHFGVLRDLGSARNPLTAKILSLVRR